MTPEQISDSVKAAQHSAQKVQSIVDRINAEAMAQFPAFTHELAEQVTLQDCTDYLKANGDAFARSATAIFESPVSRLEVAAWLYGGDNCMAHHYQQARSGLQVITLLGSAANEKWLAGKWLIAARRTRARGYPRDARAFIERAALHRKAAQKAAKNGGWVEAPRIIGAINSEAAA